MGTATERAHGLLQMPHVPTLAEVKPLWPAHYDQARGDDHLHQQLADLGLRAYVDAAGNYWFGRADAGVAEHERWLYVIPREQLDEESTWECIRYGTMDDCEGRYLMYQRLGFLDEIRELTELAHGVIALVLTTRELTPAEEQAIRQKVIVMRRACTYVSAWDMHQMIEAPWNQDLHDIMHHYEAWCERQDAAEMPRSIVLRMYRMENYMAASAEGWKWFKHISAGSIA